MLSKTMSATRVATWTRQGDPRRDHADLGSVDQDPGTAAVPLPDMEYDLPFEDSCYPSDRLSDGLVADRDCFALSCCYLLYGDIHTARKLKRHP